MSIIQAEANHLLTVEELAQKLSVPIQTIYYWVSRNEIPFIKMGRHNRFIFQEVIDAFKKKTRMKIASKKPFGLI